jgi:transposase-like protein
MICKYCGSEKVVKNGHACKKQFYLCKNCDHKFVEPETYPKMRTKGHVIATAIDMFFEGLSARKVQVQIGKIFGVKVSQVSVARANIQSPVTSPPILLIRVLLCRESSYMLLHAALWRCRKQPSVSLSQLW